MCSRVYEKYSLAIGVVFDFGCGINGFSYPEFAKLGFNVKYIGTEPVGQLCELQNYWFEKRGMNAKVEHISLFDLMGNVKLIREENFSELSTPLSAESRPAHSNSKKFSRVKSDSVKVAFFFKVLDSLEMLKRNYSKEVLDTIVPLVDGAVVSWATKSLVSKKKFHAERKWLKEFILEHFKILNEFDLGVEHYIVFSKK